MAGGREWTTAEVRTLHELRAKHVSAREIGLILNRTPYAIYCYVRYVPWEPGKSHGLKAVPRCNRWTSDEIETLRILAASGVTKKRAGFHLNRTFCAIKTIAQKNGISFAGDAYARAA